MLHTILRSINPFGIISEWAKWERRKIACQALERQQPGRVHTATEWNALADDLIRQWESSLPKK